MFEQLRELAEAPGGGDVILIATGLGCLVVLAILSLLLLSGGDRGRERAAGMSRGGRQGGLFGGVGRRADQGSKVTERLKELEKERKTRSAVTLRLRLEQAGLSISPSRFLLFSQIFGLMVGASVYAFGGQNIAAALAAGVIGAFGVPRLVLSKLIAGRRARFIEHFAGAIDILVRGVRSGLPVNEGMRVIGTELPEPVSGEFRLLNDSVAIGVPLEDALERMANRVPSPDVDFFRTVLAIQKQTGGNLAESLSNLSDVLRNRKKLKGKIKALSSEARMSAIIIGSLPFIVCLAMYVLRPDYITELFTDPFGQQLIAGGLAWMSIGVFMMRSMIKFEM
ncbi:MAG: type II secretion system F family protein [Pseudomonadota bacterium]